MNYISRAKFSKRAASFFILLMINQMFFPAVALALTSGPTQPELQSFEPVGTTEMVDLFSGDFTYNIPLFDLPGPNGGYPVNLFYNSVTSPEAEASMVGLGWNLGIGAINRQMRGLPDDFNGDLIEREVDQKDNVNRVYRVSGGLEMPGVDESKNNSNRRSLGFNLGFSYTINSLKGQGISFDPGVSLGYKLTDKFSFGVGFGMSMGSFDGGSGQANLSVSYNRGGVKKVRRTARGSASLQLAYGGLSGHRMSLGLNGGYNKFRKGSTDQKESLVTTTGVSIGLMPGSETTYTPLADRQFKGSNFSANFDVGGSASFAYWKGGLHYSQSIRKLARKNFKAKAYGVEYLGEARDDNQALTDHNTEGQTAIQSWTTNLPIPSITSDVLSVTGQGVGGAYQPYRNDIAVVTSRDNKVHTYGGSAGVELGLGAPLRIGLDLDYNHQKEHVYNHQPEYGNNIGAQRKTASDPFFEPYYYKGFGEMSTERLISDAYLMGDDLVSPLKSRTNESRLRSLTTGATLADVKGRGKRKARSKSIQPYKNRELATGVLPEFNIQYYNKQGDAVIDGYSVKGSLSRPLMKENHTGAYTVLSEEGLRWNYGLAVQNVEQKEYAFSVAPEIDPCKKVIDIDQRDESIHYKVNHTEEYLDITTTPSYAHSYMLTSILGTNYIDMDPTDGEPNDEDQGYWVRFEYAKTSDAYIWRSPFLGATYSQGKATAKIDDKGSFTAGKREQYYVARIETKTHRAEFAYSQREDAYGAGDYIQDQNSNIKYGDSSYKLDSIRIFSKQELATKGSTAIPMKVVHFEYSYELCPGTENNVNGGGKLTLKKVYFTYENSNRGALNPYQFEYPDQGVSYANYYALGVDRWGTNRGELENACTDSYISYTQQTNSLVAPLTKQEMADRASVWHLKKIKLPSGSTIELELERDEYGYEQDHVAGQMFNIVAFGDPLNPYDEEKLIENTTDISCPDSSALAKLHTSELSDLNTSGKKEALSIYFKLEEPISNDAAAEAKFERYFTDLYEDDKGKQLYLRYAANVFGQYLASDGYHENVVAYLYIKSYELVPSASGGDYLYGRIILKDYGAFSSKVNKYHPLAINIWQYIKFNLLDQFLGEPPLTGTGPAGGDGHAWKRMMKNAILSIKNFYTVCRERQLGKKGNLKRSFIRLNTPDRRMFGDGLRVKRVLLKDHWTKENTPVYGMVYDYDTQDENGEVISSGVAAATPVVGREASGLRYAKHYMKAKKRNQNELYFFEYPYNENFLPGASIGYSKVTVRSLATEASLAQRKGEPFSQAYQDAGIDPNLKGFASSGQSIHEFYTAKDFPYILKAGKIDRKYRANLIPIPLLGFNKYAHYRGSQAYSVELNNMHGRLKKVSQYAQSKDGEMLDSPISWVEYNYKHRVESYVEGIRLRERKVLTSFVPVLLSDTGGADYGQNVKVEYQEMGVDREMTVGAEKNSSRAVSIGAGLNTLWSLPLFIVPVVAGHGHITNESMQTQVTNKVIRRAAIMDKVVAYNGQSRVETENLLYDQYTGQALLTRVNNNYDDAIYSYNLPAHFFYKGVGPAYKNWGAEFLAAVGNQHLAGTNNRYVLNLSPQLPTTWNDLMEGLITGDEYLAYNQTNPSSPAVKFTLLSKYEENSNCYLEMHSDDPVALGSTYQLKVIRSGARNQLTASVGSITALSDPTKNRAVVSCDGPLELDAITYSCDTETEAIAAELADFLNATLDVDNLGSAATTSSYLGNSPTEAYANRINTGGSAVLSSKWTQLASLINFEDCSYSGCTVEPVDPANPNDVSVNYLEKDGETDTSYTTYSTPDCFEGLVEYNPAKIKWEPEGTHLLNPIYYYLEGSQGNVLKIGAELQHFVDVSLQSYSNNAIQGTTYPKIESYAIRGCNRFSGIDVLEIAIEVKMRAATDPVTFILATDRIFCHEFQWPAEEQLSLPLYAYRTINDVLNISAAELSEDWLQMHASASDNPYATGERGIYRMLNSYAYVDERRQTTSTVNLREDGAMDSVVLFEWNRPVLMQDCEAFDKWKKTNTITKYNSDNAETENRNIIGLYSSALYGYNGSLPIAVAANAKQEEIAFEGFEEYATTTNLNNLPHIETGQLNFGNQTDTDYAIYHRLDVAQPFYWTDGQLYLDEPYQSSWSNYYQGQNMRLHLRDEAGKAQSDRIIIDSLSASPNGKIIIHYDPNGLDIPSAYRLTGAVSIERKLPSQEVSNTMASLSDETAHTGNLSIKLQANRTFNFDNSMMELEADKAYVFSCWVKLDNADRPTYQPFVDLLTSSNLQLLSDMSPTGTIIDGWQRMEGQFSIPEAALLSATYEGLLGLQNKHETKALYIDDLRIFPAEGGLQTYIYDPVNYKVRATLDNNNFFSRYLYNQEGTLIAVQKETERGIKTIQETGSHMKTTDVE
ncbi:hypothetical protein SapgrDRAFT_0039 [Saprospira grandis DSM 2844]|uniref:RHS repeat-associated core domain protein n=1 Tax=Saprospira grandis DSM 2844 TaxID=694433 RepID=J1HZJ1_9BACT|nr:hypothetical protein [Saprospira grandis]EJF51800.1 hypothetical protein SapgrDRAFT_0039 [Saprospira grandis DSM 2844]